ncbi:MAG: hypothetical protein ACXVX9_11615 [Mycobacteriaceae bacterium]
MEVDRSHDICTAAFFAAGATVADPQTRDTLVGLMASPRGAGP